MTISITQTVAAMAADKIAGLEPAAPQPEAL